MKILNRAVDQSISPGSFTDLVSWSADGSKKVLGFIGRGQFSAIYRFLIGADNCGEYETSLEDATAYVIGAASIPTAATTVKVQVYHEAPQAKNFSGWLLEG
jgi:hypothetical protein